MIVDIAVYEHGKRLDGSWTPTEARELTCTPDRFAWIGLADPTTEEFESITTCYDLHPLAVEDALHAHQRPKLERYGDSLFLVVKTLEYVDRNEVFDFGEVMMFVGIDHVITVRHGGGCNLGGLRKDLEAVPERLAMGPSEVVHALTDHVVDRYEWAVRAVQQDVDEIQSQVFAGPSKHHAGRIFRLMREVLDFRQAVAPLEDPMETLARFPMPAVPAERRPYFQNVHDHVKRVTDRIDAIEALLGGALHANVAQVGMRQNEDMRKISAWVAIVSVPTMVAGLYGMNFDHMPELGWRFGYPMALAIIAVTCTLLYRNFKKRDWL